MEQFKKTLCVGIRYATTAVQTVENPIHIFKIQSPPAKHRHPEKFSEFCRLRFFMQDGNIVLKKFFSGNVNNSEKLIGPKRRLRFFLWYSEIVYEPIVEEIISKSLHIENSWDILKNDSVFKSNFVHCIGSVVNAKQ